MKFARIYGPHDPTEAKQAEDKMSKVFVELAGKIESTSMITGLGGDPLVFSLLLPIEHIASAAIPTAATDGKRYIWNIKWILNASYLKLMLTCFHEAFHAQFMHPQRRGNRDPRLWNIVIDYVVMGMILDWLKHRFRKSANPIEKAIATFKEAFGNYITVAQLTAKYLNPYKDIPGIESWSPEPIDLEAAMKPFKIEDDLDEEDIEWIKAHSAVDYKYVYADPDLEAKFKNPYVLYDALLKAIPKCDACGKLGAITNSSSGNGAGPGSGDGDGDTCSHEGHTGKQGDCAKCCGADSVMDFGGTADVHMDCNVDPQEMAKRLQDAVEMAKRIGAGYVPEGLVREIGELSKPRIRWQDEVRMTKQKAEANGSKNDYTRFKTRPLFAAMFVPRKKGYTCKFAVCIDTSGSRSKDEVALGLSQLQSLDNQGSGVVVCCDAAVYWDEATKLRSCKADELRGVKTRGGGGTALAGFFDGYEKRLGKQDFLIVMTDGLLDAGDVRAMKKPDVPVFWLITNEAEFQAPFGKVFRLTN